MDLPIILPRKQIKTAIKITNHAEITNINLHFQKLMLSLVTVPIPSCQLHSNYTGGGKVSMI